MNRTVFPGGSISWENGVHGKTESVFTRGTGAGGAAGAGTLTCLAIFGPADA